MTVPRALPGAARGVTVLDAADLVVIAGRVLGIGIDAALAQMDAEAARDALSEAALASAGLPGPARDGAGCGQPAALRDRADAATAGVGLVHALLRHRPFPRHCEQVAVAAGLQFLSLNGWRADLDPPGPAVVVVEALASGQLAPGDAAAWLCPRLSPAGRAMRALPIGMPRVRTGRVPHARAGRVPHARAGRVPHVRAGIARKARTGGSRQLPASRVPVRRVPVRRVVASALLAVTVGGAALMATACSRGPTAPTAPAHPSVLTHSSAAAQRP